MHLPSEIKHLVSVFSVMGAMSPRRSPMPSRSLPDVIINMSTGVIDLTSRHHRCMDESNQNWGAMRARSTI